MKSIFFLTIGIFCAALGVFALSNTSEVIEQSKIISCRKCNRPDCSGGGWLMASCDNCSCPCQKCIIQNEKETDQNLAGCGCRDRDCDVTACKSCNKKKKKLPIVTLVSYQSS